MAFNINKRYPQRKIPIKPPMDKQLLLEKTTFAMQYYGQEVLVQKNRVGTLPLTALNLHAIEDGHLRLRTVASITENDALDLCMSIGLIKAQYFKLDEDVVIKDDGYSIIFNNKEVQMYLRGEVYYDDYITINQILQSKGYALKWMKYSVEDLINLGWIKTYND